MGLLDRLKLNKTKDFFEWLDLILKNELNSEIKAINFNLYEDTAVSYTHLTLPTKLEV